MGTRTASPVIRRASVPARDSRAKSAVRTAARTAAKAVAKKRGRPRKPLNGEEAALGGNVRSTRIIKGLKLRDLAERVGCSESLLSKIENGRASPSVTMLHRIAASLDVTVPALFAARAAGEGMVGRNGERPSTRIDAKGSRLERLVPTGVGHSLEGNLHILAPGAGSAGTLAHAGEEVGFVLTGQLELVVDGGSASPAGRRFLRVPLRAAAQLSQSRTHRDARRLGQHAAHVLNTPHLRGATLDRAGRGI